MTDNFNKLTNDETERLAILAEESAEVIQIIGKVLRHGYDSCYPGSNITNRSNLEKELGQVANIMGILLSNNDIDIKNIEKHAKEKSISINQWLHHNEVV